MNNRYFVLSMAISWLLFTVLAQAEGLDFQDGFYIEDNNGKSKLKIRVKDYQGKARKIVLIAYTNLTVKSISVYSLKPSEDASQVQINVLASESDWSKKSIVLVVQGKPYFELAKSGTIRGNSGTTFSAAVSLKLHTEAEAKLIQERLNKRFSLGEQ